MWRDLASIGRLRLLADRGSVGAGASADKPARGALPRVDRGTCARWGACWGPLGRARGRMPGPAAGGQTRHARGSPGVEVTFTRRERANSTGEGVAGGDVVFA